MSAWSRTLWLVASLLSGSIVAVAPSALALSCVEPPDRVWTSIVELGGDVETTFLAHGPSGGSGCSTASDNAIGARWYVWEEYDRETQRVSVKVLERGTANVHVIDYAGAVGTFGLRAGDLRGDVLVHPITDHREGRLVHRFYLVDVEHGRATRLGLELPRDTQVTITGMEVMYLTHDRGVRLNVYDAAAQRHVVRDRPLQPNGNGVPDRLLAADGDRLVVAATRSEEHVSVPWLYDRDGRPVRALDEIDPHGGLSCARFDGDRLYFAYHEEPTLPWFPTPARLDLGSGRVQVLEKTSHGAVQPCAPVHDGSMAVFSEERPAGPYTDLIERDAGTVELPVPTGLLLPLAFLAWAALGRRPRHQVHP